MARISLLRTPFLFPNPMDPAPFLSYEPCVLTACPSSDSGSESSDGTKSPPTARAKEGASSKGVADGRGFVPRAHDIGFPKPCTPPTQFLDATKAASGSHQGGDTVRRPTPALAAVQEPEPQPEPEPTSVPRKKRLLQATSSPSSAPKTVSSNAGPERRRKVRSGPTPAPASAPAASAPVLHPQPPSPWDLVQAVLPMLFSIAPGGATPALPAAPPAATNEIARVFNSMVQTFEGVMGPLSGKPARPTQEPPLPVSGTTAAALPRMFVWPDYVLVISALGRRVRQLSLYPRGADPQGPALATVCVSKKSRVVLRAASTGLHIIVDGFDAMFLPTKEGQTDPVLLRDLALHLADPCQ